MADGRVRAHYYFHGSEFLHVRIIERVVCVFNLNSFRLFDVFLNCVDVSRNSTGSFKISVVSGI